MELEWTVIELTQTAKLTRTTSVSAMGLGLLVRVETKHKPDGWLRPALWTCCMEFVPNVKISGGKIVPQH